MSSTTGTVVGTLEYQLNRAQRRSIEERIDFTNRLQKAHKEISNLTSVLARLINEDRELQARLHRRNEQRDSWVNLASWALRAQPAAQNYERPGCSDNASIFWTPSADCASQTLACGHGDMHFALQNAAVPRCGLTGASLRHFNRSSTKRCFDRLARTHRPWVGNRSDAATSPALTIPSFRLLFMGMSNTLHVWHALVQDDSSDWEKAPDFRKRRPHDCRVAVPDAHLKAYEPHAIDYRIVLVLTPDVAVGKRTSESCWKNHAIGGGSLMSLVKRASAPYDVIVMYMGLWDAAFTPRDTPNLEQAWDADLAYLLLAWPQTEVIMFTLTPCGPTQVANQSAEKTPLRRYTTLESCEWIPTFNRVVRNLSMRYPSRVRLLDAHQMVTSRPGADVAGYPPGIWPNQRAGVHFEGETITPKDRAANRRMSPPSAGGEMNRALANRVLDFICPALD
mmetsp:Transcript_15452/g.39864  ORF Transcript_15452/g.39864 Transcript_15452/m.39864 type:complete len:451 (+) Transcript_15452:115-1467(+)